MTRLVRFLQFISFWLFWPGVAVIAWGELTPHPPDLGGVFYWDKLQHFTAYFGLAAMATLVLGVRARLGPAIVDIILFGGMLEMLQGFTGRDPDIFDFLANSIGALSGTAVGLMFLMAAGPLVAAGRPD